MRVSVQLRVRQMNALRGQTQAAFAEFGEKQAKEAARRIKANIRGGRYPFAPLAASTVAAKKRKKLDRRILIATGAYVNSIQARSIGKNKWFVGPRPGATHGRISMAKLAVWHEYGTRHMPARPHYRVEAMRMRIEMGKRAKNDLVSRIARGMIGKEKRVR